MYKIIIYEDADGHSELNEFLMDLANRACSNKDARIQLKQITLYVELLRSNGTRLNQNITKHIQGEIWELRPGNNRILFFYFDGETYVLLHYFRKKSQKTPKSEIEKAEREIKDYKNRIKENKL